MDMIIQVQDRQDLQVFRANLTPWNYARYATGTFLGLALTVSSALVLRNKAKGLTTRSVIWDLPSETKLTLGSTWQSGYSLGKNRVLHRACDGIADSSLYPLHDFARSASPFGESG